MTVTAKDSTGTNVGHGGDTFKIGIYNKWTIDGNGLCNTDAGAKQTMTSPLSAIMTDNGDGTYIYNFSVQLDGAVTIIIRLTNTGIVNWKWYSNSNFSGAPVKTNTTNTINFVSNDIFSNFIPGQNTYFTGIVSGIITPPFTSTYTFYFGNDDGSRMYFNHDLKVDNLYSLGVFSNSFTVSLVEGAYYNFLIYYYQGPVYIKLTLSWSWDYFSITPVPSSAFTTNDIIGSSPYLMTTVWPTGYRGSDPSSPTKWKEICGDGIKVGDEQWDDGNTINNDGCQSDCTLITPGFAWATTSGSVDVCIKWLTGYAVNSDKTAWLPIWGDGLRVPKESWDDGNLTNGDGCSSSWSIESGYSCTGGSTTSKDIWVRWSAGFYQDSSNPTSWIPHCGDGLRAGSEAWDDGNTKSGDWWKGDWTSIESGCIWTGGSTTKKDYWVKWEKGYYQNNPSDPTSCISKCGDGIRVGYSKYLIR